MISNGAKLIVDVDTGVTPGFEEVEEPQVYIILYLPEVEKRIIYEIIPLEDFDSPEFVMDYINDIKGDAILLGCEFEDTGFEAKLEEIFYSNYGLDDSEIEID
jgi:hypothetical protein